MRFLFNLSIVSLGIFICTIASGAGLNPFIVACVFVGAWFLVVQFDKSLWWLIIFAMVFSLIYYDKFGLWFGAIVIFVFLLREMIAFVLRTSIVNYRFLIFMLSFTIANIFYIFVSFVNYHRVSFSLNSLFFDFLSSVILFYLTFFVIRQVERIVKIYVREDNICSHV